MKISVLSGLFQRFLLEKTFKMVSDIGFDGIELHGMRPTMLIHMICDEERCNDVLHLKEQYNLEISMYTPGTADVPL